MMSVSEFDDLDDLSLSQAVDVYELSSQDLKHEFDGLEFPSMDLGNFDLNNDDFIHFGNTNKRFGKAVTVTDIKQLQRQQESKNTRKNTSWGYKVFNEWRQTRQFPDLTECSDTQLDHVLSCFVVEARRADRSPYPPRTLHQLCAALLRHMRENGVSDKTFLDSKNMKFNGFRKTLDARMKQLSAEGVGVGLKQADPITADMENVLWEKGLLGKNTSKAVINTIFYYNCKLFGLRGLDEHRALDVRQFSCEEKNGKFVIILNGKTSKNFAGGLNQRNITAKSIEHFSESGGPRSLYDIYKEYIGMIKSGPMYRRPLEARSGQLKFSAQPIGVNKLSTLVKTMCQEAGLQGNFSNHSGKRTCATTLFQSGFDEQTIMNRTGHRSTAVRAYKRPSEEQLQHVSKALEPPISVQFQERKENDGDLKRVKINCQPSIPVQFQDRKENEGVLQRVKIDCQQSESRIPFINISNCEVNIVYK